VKNSWVLVTAVRFLKNRKATRGLATALLSSAGIAAGVAALIVVLSVMNGFQLGFIDDILEISSYHIRLRSEVELSDELLIRLQEFAEVRSIVPFADSQTLVYGEFSGLEACRLRGVPDSVGQIDPGFINQLNIIEGGIDPSIPRSIVLGNELAAKLAAGPGSQVSLLTLSGSGFKSLNPETVSFTVTGIFESGYYQYDRGLAVISLQDARELSGINGGSFYGIKLQSKGSVNRAMVKMKSILGNEGISLDSWKEYNSSFFGTLRTEKLVMILLLCLIFLVTGFNTYHSLKRAIYEKREQIAVLRTLGASPKNVRRIFIIDGALIGFGGGTFGVVVGLLIAGNINTVFDFVEGVINLALRWIGGFQDMSFFSPVYFYLTAVPTRILFAEILGIFLAGFLSSLGAAYIASRKISEIRPSQVLRYE
jgi:lipoprotein-releasing system permease protein